MSVSEQTRRRDYTASASQTTFAYNFTIEASTDIKVYVDDELSTAYTLTGVGTAGGGNVVFNSGLTGGEHVVIIGDMPIEQDTSFSTGGPLPAADIVAALDKGVQISQEIQERVGRALKFPITSTESEVEVDDPVAGAVAYVKDDGNIGWGLLDDLGGITPEGDTVLPGYTAASFPADAGTLASLTDRNRGVAIRRSSGIVPLNGGIFNVKDFLATGDGSTDDTAAVAAAFTAHAASTAGGTVFFPAGHYLVDTDALDIASTAAKPLTIAGEGHASYIEFVNAGGTTPLGLDGASIVDLVIRDIRLGGEASRIIELSGTGPALIERVDISGATVADTAGSPVYGAGILIDGLSDVTISRCYLHGNGYTTGGNPVPYDIVFYSAGSRNRVEACRIVGDDTDGAIAAYNQTHFCCVGNDIDQGNKGNGTSNGYGILVYGTPTDYYQCGIAGNNVRNCAGSGIYVAGSFNPTIVRNEVYDACKNLSDASLPAAGISLNLDAGYRAEVVGNKVRTSTKAGISFVGKAIVSGNTIMGTITTDGIQMRGTSAGSPNDYSVITGNTISSCVQHGIGQVTGTGTEAVGVVIEGNTLDLVATCDRGISALNATRWVIKGNAITGASGADYGIDLAADADMCIVEGNQVVGWDVGIRDLGTLNAITGNNLTSNTAAMDVTAGTGIRRGNLIAGVSEDGAVVTANVGNVGGGEDNLQTSSIAANRFTQAGQAIRISAWGTVANNSNPKTVKLYFGATAILTTALTISQAGTWAIEAIVTRTGTSAQDYVARLNQGGTTTLVDVEAGTLTETETAAITVKCTGTVTDGGGGINNDDIVQSGLVVSFLS